MSENTTNATKTQQVTEAFKNVLSGLGERAQAAVGELNKIQNKAMEQASTLADTAARATQEQIAFAEQMGTEWRKLMLAATRSATSLFTRNNS